MLVRNYKYLRVVTCLLVFSLFTFGFGLNWGRLLPFHPDENNIVMAVNQIKWPNQLNPRFFAYGSLTIYLASFINQLTNINPRLFLRLISFGASFLGLWLIYKWLSLLDVNK